ncbi:c-type cytochrome [Luteimonas sp. e5]
MRPILIVACLVLALPIASLARQDAGTPASGKSQGAELTYTCIGCHGIEGYKNVYPNYHVPKLGGQQEQYLRNALSEYKAGKRKHPTMEAQAMSFSDEEIAIIAAYLSSLKPQQANTNK